MIMQPVPGFDGYFVTEDGDVFSTRPVNGRGPLTVIPRKLAGGVDSGGYRYVTFCRGPQRINVSVHLVVLKTFVGPCPDGMEGCHEDGNKRNCALSNLRWDTRKNNHADKARHGTKLLGEKNPKSVLNEENVREVRRLSSCGCSNAEIARVFGVTPQSIQAIIIGKNWAHVHSSKVIT